MDNEGIGQGSLFQSRLRQRIARVRLTTGSDRTRGSRLRFSSPIHSANRGCRDCSISASSPYLRSSSPRLSFSREIQQCFRYRLQRLQPVPSFRFEFHLIQTAYSVLRESNTVRDKWYFVYLVNLLLWRIVFFHLLGIFPGRMLRYEENRLRIDPRNRGKSSFESLHQSAFPALKGQKIKPGSFRVLVSSRDKENALAVWTDGGGTSFPPRVS